MHISGKRLSRPWAGELSPKCLATPDVLNGYGGVEAFQSAFLAKLMAMHGAKLPEAAFWQQYTALAGLVRDCIGPNWQATRERYRENNAKQVYYLSIEFLPGRLLGTNLLHLGLWDVAGQALRELGIDLNELEQQEPDAGLGNGGLGRLAACYLDAMASGSLPGHGYGIRYQHGLFEQKLIDQTQHEYPDQWLKDGYVWEYRRPDEAVAVVFGGGEHTETVLAVPYDVPVVGYQNSVINTLRLWSAEVMPNAHNCSLTKRRDCQTAAIAAISGSLYPDDSRYDGKALRLKQQYLLVAASLKSILREHKAANRPVQNFHHHVAIHINDTHPAMAIPELMRLLTAEEGLNWEEAWNITVKTMSYTNHTVMPEALETWPVELVQSLLPRIYDIIHDMNERFCSELWASYPGEWAKIAHMALIADGQVHMAHLAIAGSHSVNGVASIHTEILKKQVMKNFADFYPDRFNNKTNGVSHRRWLLQANPRLARLISDTIGSAWIVRPAEMEQLSNYAADAALQQDIAAVKRHNKLALAQYIKNHYGIQVNIDSVFDVQIKRVHEYKRQLLNALHIMDLYNKLKADPNLNITPRTFIFSGKAAAGYYEAKKIIQLINALAVVINQDKSIQDKLKVVFIENYKVSLAELIIPAADVSEQISTAGKEASGTGNMKLMMNGAITLGTLDGANIEIHDAVGADNIIIFGLTAGQTAAYYQDGGYRARDVYNQDIRVKTVLEQLVNGFLPGGPDAFAALYNSLLDNNDCFFVLKDFAAYSDAQNQLQTRFSTVGTWRKMAIHNIAQSGRFVIDRTFAEYSDQIWKVIPIMPLAQGQHLNQLVLPAVSASDHGASILIQ